MSAIRIYADDNLEIIPQEDVLVLGGSSIVGWLEPSPYKSKGIGAKRWVMKLTGNGIRGYLSMVQRPEKMREFASLEAAHSVVTKLGIAEMRIANTASIRE